MKYLVLLICCISVASGQTVHGRYIQGDTIKGNTWIGLPLGGGFTMPDSAMTILGGGHIEGGLKVDLISSADSIYARAYGNLPAGMGGGLSGWYVNGNSLVTDTLRFLRPTSMVFTQSGRTIAIYPDTSAGKIATKTDLAAYLPLHATADSSVASYWASNIRGNYLKPADSTSIRNYSNALYGTSNFRGWYENGGSLQTDSLRFVPGTNITFSRSGPALTINGAAGGGGFIGWYVNGQSLVGDSLRFLTPSSMVFTESGRTLAIYPDTSAGKIATKTDLGGYLPLHGTADSSTSSYWATNLRIPRLYGWITNGGTLRTDTLRAIAGTDMILTPSTTTLTIAADTSKYATSTASGFLKFSDWTTFNNKGSGNGSMYGWYVNGQSLVSDSLRFIPPSSMVYTQSGRTLTMYPDTGAGKIATKTDVAAKGTSNYRGWYVNGQSLVTDTLRFLTPSSMVQTQSGSTLSLYPDTSAGKIATKTDVAAKGTSNFRGWYQNGGALQTDTLRFIQGTAMNNVRSTTTYTLNADTSFYALGTKSGFLKFSDWTAFNNKGSSNFAGWITNGGTLRTDTLRAIAGTYMTLTPSTTTLTITADSSKYATSTASGFLKFSDWTTFNNKGASNFRGWDINGGSLITDTLRHVPGTDITLSTSGSALTINADTSKYATSTASGFLKFSDWTTFNNKGTSNFRGWYENGGALQTDTLRLVPGTNITFGRSGTALTINGAAGAAGFYGWYTNGGSLVGDSLRFIQGANITLTQTGRTLTIAGSAGGSTTSVDSIRHTWVDTTGRTIADHGWTSITYAGDSLKYFPAKVMKIDTNGISSVGTGRFYNVDTDSTGYLRVSPDAPANGTFFAGVGAWIVNANNMSASGTQAGVSGHLRAFPFFISKKMTIDSINYEISTAGSGAMTIAIYSDSSRAGVGLAYPATKLINGSRDTTSAALKVPLTGLNATPYQFKPGLYWAVVGGNGTATYRAVPVAAIPNVLGYAPAIGSNPQYTCWDATLAYNQVFPTAFPLGAALTKNIGAPILVMRVKSVP